MHRILAEFVPALMPGRLANHGQVLTSAVTGKVESTRRPAWQLCGYPTNQALTQENQTFQVAQKSIKFRCR